jgi:hypothetical protein
LIGRKHMKKPRKEKWKIRVSGYGTFDFEGTEDEAEEMRAHKARWEQGFAMKWRTENQTPKDIETETRAARMR